MGGASKHIKNLWESDLTFEEIVNVGLDLYNGSLKCWEKMDGQNLKISYQNERLVMARTPSHMRDYGKNAIPLENIKEYFKQSTPDFIRDAFYSAMKEIETSMNMAIEDGADPDLVFCLGSKWINMEILSQSTENLIHYGREELHVHWVEKVDSLGNIKRIDRVEDMEERYYWFFDKVFNNFPGGNFDIVQSRPVTLSWRDSQKALDGIKDCLQALHMLMDHNGLGMEHNVIDYLRVEFEKTLRTCPHPIAEDTINDLVHRWSAQDKSKRITTILKEVNPDARLWVEFIDKTADIKRKEYLYPFVVVFTRLGNVVSTGIESARNDHNLAVTRMKVANAVESVQDFLEDEEEMLETAKHRLGYQLRVFEESGGVEHLYATEGVVFEVEGKGTFKLSGSSLPALHLYRHKRHSSEPQIA